MSSSERFLKIAKIMVLWAALLGSTWATELDQPMRVTVLLNKEQQPMNLKMIHLFLVSLAMPSENKAWFSDDLKAITNKGIR